MAGLAEILYEKAALRNQVAAANEQIKLLQAKLEAVMASNEQLAEIFDLMAKKKQLAKSERFIASEQQAVLFAGMEDAPARDPELEASEPPPDLFLIERRLTDANATAAERLTARKERSAPLVDGLYAWIPTRMASVRPGSKFGEALTYAINQEQRLRVFLSDANVPLHNNLSELLLRQPIVGRKNWLFAGSEGGAEAAAAWYTLIASCVLQGIDPAVYLYDVFRRIPEHSANWVHELTPWQWRLAVEAGDFVPYSSGRYA